MSTSARLDLVSGHRFVQPVQAAVTPQTRLIWVETPTNPLLSIADIAGIAEIAAAQTVKVLVDNTFASPALQQPLGRQGLAEPTQHRPVVPVAARRC